MRRILYTLSFLCCSFLLPGPAEGAEAQITVKVRIIRSSEISAKSVSEIQVHNAKIVAERIAPASQNSNPVSRFFSRIDLNNDGIVTAGEFRRRIDPVYALSLFRHLDEDGNDVLSCKEMEKFGTAKRAFL